MSSRKLISVDIEADGPVPGLYSMVSFGAVIVEDGLTRTFFAELAPISDKWVPEALAVSGVTRAIHESYPLAEKAMMDFAEWIDKECPQGATFIADNPGFDFAFINYYFHRYLGKNPFGFSSRRIGDLFCGVQKNYWYQWKKHRVTNHSHDPLDDCIGNAEAILYMRDVLGLRIP